MTQKETVLMMLRQGTVTTNEFIRTVPLGAEYRRCVSELRRDGYRVEAKRLHKGCWEYRLVEDVCAS